MARYNKRSAQALLFLLTVTDISTTCAEVIFDAEDDYCKVVEASVTVNNNSPIQDYVHPDDHTQPNYEYTKCYISWDFK